MYNEYEVAIHQEYKIINRLDSRFADLFVFKNRCVLLVAGKEKMVAQEIPTACVLALFLTKDQAGGFFNYAD